MEIYGVYKPWHFIFQLMEYKIKKNEYGKQTNKNKKKKINYQVR